MDHEFNIAHPFRLSYENRTGDIEELAFTTDVDRDAAAAQLAAQLGVVVDHFDYDHATAETTLTGGWWLTGASYPPGQAPAPVDQRTRFAARAARPGDLVTVFGAPAGEFGTTPNSQHQGRIRQVAGVPLWGTTEPGLRFTFDDGRQVDCVATAVTTIHELAISGE